MSFPNRRLVSSSPIGHLIQALPPIQRWRASIHQPLLLLQSTHRSVSTSIFLCVRTRLWLTDHLAPSLHGRSPRHERPMVGFSDPIGEPTREHQYSQISRLSTFLIARCRVQREPIPPVTGQRGVPSPLEPRVALNHNQPVRNSIFSI